MDDEKEQKNQISLIYNRPRNSYLSRPTFHLFTNAFLVISTVIVNERLDNVTSNHVINIGVLGLATTAISLCIVSRGEVC